MEAQVEQEEKEDQEKQGHRAKAFLGGVYPQGFPGGSDSKESSSYAGDPSLTPGLGRSLGREDPLEKGMATHSSILAWRILRTEKPGGLQTVG